MPPKNISGNGDPNKNLVNQELENINQNRSKNANGQSPSGRFMSDLPDLSGDSKRRLASLNEYTAQFENQARREERYYRNTQNSLAEESKRLRDLAREKKTDSKDLENKIKLTDKYSDVEIKSFKRLLGIKQQEHSEALKQAQTIDTVRRANKRASDERLDSYDEIRGSLNETERKIKNLAVTEKSSFGGHLLANNFSPTSAMRTYGMNKMQTGFSGLMNAGAGGEGAMSSLGGMAGGAVAVGGGLIIGKALEKGFEVFTRGLKNSIAYGDISKSVSGTGETSAGLRTRIAEGQQGLGTSLEEQVAMASQLRMQVGRVGSENFAETMRVGSGLDRGMGMETGTGTAMLGNLIRKTGMQSSETDMNKFALTISEAIGRGKLVGLQEEMVKGVAELVDLTRSQSISGVEPGLFADMIADLSSRGAKNLRGADAAQAIGGLSTALSQGQTPYATIVAQMALQSTIQKMEKQTGRSLKDFDPATLFRMQRQGVGLQIEGKDGKTYAAGDTFLNEAVRINKEISGNDDIAALSGEALGMTAAQTKAWGSLPASATKQGFDKLYGFDQKEYHSSPGSDKFMMDLSEQVSKGARGRAPENISTAEKKAWLSMAATEMGNNLQGAQKEEYDNVRNRTSSLTPEEQFKQMLEFAGNIKEVTPEDSLRNVVNDIDLQIQSLIQGLVPTVAKIAYWLDHKFLGNTKEAEKAGEESMLNLRKFRDDHDPVKIKEKARLEAEQRDYVAKVGDPTSKEHVEKTAKDRATEQYQQYVDQQIRDNKWADVSDDDRKKVYDQYYNKALGEEQNKAKAAMPASGKYSDLINQDAMKEGVDPAMISAMLKQESTGDPNAVSGKGATGLMQLMPDTAKELGVTDATDPAQNIAAGTKYYKQLLDRYKGDEEKALVAYNWGSKHADKWDGDRSSLPKETRQYLERIYDKVQTQRAENTNAQAPPRDYGQMKKETKQAGLNGSVEVTANVVHKDGLTGAPIAPPQSFSSTISSVKPKTTYTNTMQGGQ